MFLGYPSGTNGWKLFDLENETVFISRDVEFQEDVFPYSEYEKSSPTTETPVLIPHQSNEDDTEFETEYIAPSNSAIEQFPLEKEPSHTEQLPTGANEQTNTFV